MSTTARADGYEELALRGTTKNGIVIARYGGSWRGIKPGSRPAAVGCLIFPILRRRLPPGRLASRRVTTRIL
jgi:hypothetical protein